MHPSFHHTYPALLFSYERRRQRMRAFLATFERPPPVRHLPARPTLTPTITQPKFPARN